MGQFTQLFAERVPAVDRAFDVLEILACFIHERIARYKFEAFRAT
jgi:hypothetical protein